MSRAKSVITINFAPPAVRWLLLIPALLAIFASWYATRWYVGNVVAEYAPAPDQGGTEMAQLAVRWAPDDPLTHWRLASFEEKNFTAENIADAVHEYELAVQAAPYDYRYWMELGRALEAAGDRDNSERALRRAVELAPNYSHPLWQYGNVLVRQGKIDEAFAQLSKAAEADNTMCGPVFGLAMQVFNGNVDQIIKVLPSPGVRMEFAVTLINLGKFEEASRVLRTVSASDRKGLSELTDEAVKALLTKKQFRVALSILRETEPDATQLPTVEQVWNGSFESNIPPSDSKPFHWLINSRPQAQLSIDARAHSGNRSLRMVFKAPNKLDSINASQTVIVQPDTSYRLQFYLRTDDLLSVTTPLVAIVDEGSGASLAQSQPAPTGTNEWQLVTIDFKTKPGSDGITILFSRAVCSEEKGICPIFGSIWYDDFNLQRIGSAGSSGRSAGTEGR